MSRARHRLAVGAVALCLITTACATEAEPDEGTEQGPAGDLSPAEVAEAALTDVEQFWEDRYPQVYGDELRPLEGGFFAFGPETPTDELPPCGPDPLVYEDIAANAFYCPPDDLIGWDVPNLIEPLYDQFGAFTIGVVMAHEFGHAIQVRGDVSGDTIMMELQADCFAGAWTGAVDAGESELFEVGVEDLDQAVAGLLELRDGLGTAASDPLAHGSGFDRVNAFQDGLEQSVERCADYPDLYARGELVIVEIPFGSQADFERGGNLDPETLLPLALTNLDAFFGQLLAQRGSEWPPVGSDEVLLYDPATDEVSCGDETFGADEAELGSFYCVPDDVIALDIVNLGRELYEIGDFALVTELARLFALRAQELLDVDASSSDEVLHADCLTGVYAAATFRGDIDVPEEDSLALSPGDLDESIIGFLAFGGEGGSDTLGSAEDGPSAFGRTDAFRDGFVEGAAACQAFVA